MKGKPLVHVAARAIFVVAALLLIGVPDLSAQVVRQLTNVKTGYTSVGELDDAGSSVFAVSSADPHGTNPRHTFQIFRWDPVTGLGTQMTSFEDGVESTDFFEPSVSDDGQRLVFVSRGDLTGANPDRSQELFAMNGDGSDLVQLTEATALQEGRLGHYAVAGVGNRVVFVSSVDYLGANRDHDYQVFLVNTDGTGLRQLTDRKLGGSWADISDDGERIVFSSTQIYAVNADGSDLRQLFGAGASGSSQISGDGSAVVFTTNEPPPPDNPGWCGAHSQVVAIDWDGSNIETLTGHCLGATVGAAAYDPDVTDDGQVILYRVQGGDIWKVNRDATGTTQLTDTVPTALCGLPRVSGDGSRVAFYCWGGEVYGGYNPDGRPELYAMNSDGTGHRQLSEVFSGFSAYPAISADGSWVTFVSSADPLREGPGTGRQVYRVASDGSELSRLTNLADATPEEPLISNDGEIIAFRDGFSIYSVHADGSGLTELTDSATNYHPYDLSGDGRVVVFSDGSSLYLANTDGSGLAFLADGSQPGIDANGTWVAFNHSGYVHRIRSDGQMMQQLTDFAGSQPDISADGALIVFDSKADPLHRNRDGNSEIFLYDTSPPGRTLQLTSTTSGDNEIPRITPDGSYIYFHSSTPHFETDYFDGSHVYRVNVGTGVIERVDALKPCWSSAPVVPSHDGSMAAFSARGDCAGENPDNDAEVYLIDRTTIPRLSVSPGAEPTVISWDAVSGPVRYDVIRGDVANLSFAGDGTVDLGPVVCIENDSPDMDTRGFEDAELPFPGEVFFYLFRGSQGVNDGPGSFGQASTGEERVQGAGGCAG